MNLWLVFLTGLTVGGLTCMAVQGGLLASIIAAREEEDIKLGSRRKHTLLPVLMFLLTKLAAYTLLGFILGLFGGALGIADNVRLVMQIIAGVYMLAIAANLLNIHPVFRYAVLRPPKFLARMVRNQSKSKDLFAPAFLGALTIFIPCGTTVAMEAVAISSGKGILGALIMAAFVVGTIPLFFGLGALTTALGDRFKAKFLKIAAFLLIYLGTTSVNGALVALGSPFTGQSLVDIVPLEVNLEGSDNLGVEDQFVKIVKGVQTADIQVLPGGYNPSYIRVKAKLPVRLNLTAIGGLGCTSVFRIPSLGIIRSLGQTKSAVIDFTPQNPGKLTWTCSMGMYWGTIEVI